MFLWHAHTNDQCLSPELDYRTQRSIILLIIPVFVCILVTAHAWTLRSQDIIYNSHLLLNPVLIFKQLQMAISTKENSNCHHYHIRPHGNTFYWSTIMISFPFFSFSLFSSHNREIFKNVHSSYHLFPIRPALLWFQFCFCDKNLLDIKQLKRGWFVFSLLLHIIANNWRAITAARNWNDS